MICVIFLHYQHLPLPPFQKINKDPLAAFDSDTSMSTLRTPFLVTTFVELYMKCSSNGVELKLSQRSKGAKSKLLSWIWLLMSTDGFQGRFSPNVCVFMCVCVSVCLCVLERGGPKNTDQGTIWNKTKQKTYSHIRELILKSHFCSRTNQLLRERSMHHLERGSRLTYSTNIPFSMRGTAKILGGKCFKSFLS